jgi:hypothetical protein
LQNILIAFTQLKMVKDIFVLNKIMLTVIYIHIFYS